MAVSEAFFAYCPHFRHDRAFPGLPTALDSSPSHRAARSKPDQGRDGGRGGGDHCSRLPNEETEAQTGEDDT